MNLVIYLRIKTCCTDDLTWTILNNHQHAASEATACILYVQLSWALVIVLGGGE